MHFNVVDALLGWEQHFRRRRYRRSFC